MLTSKVSVSRVHPSKGSRPRASAAPRYGKVSRLITKLICLSVLLAVAAQEGLANGNNPDKAPASANAQKQFTSSSARANPFSLANIQKAMRKLARKGVKTGTARTALIASDEEMMPMPVDGDDRVYSYLRFDPNGVNGELLRQLEAEDAIQVMDFPFANGEIYNDEFALDEGKAEQMRDGYLYAVLKKSSPLTWTLLNSPELGAVELNELYLPAEDDTELQLTAFEEAGYTEDQVARLRICLFKRPTGFVRYWDNQYGRLEPVRGMQVWGLVFGIPLHTYTDANGYYSFPWRFSAGTIMGTHAKNPRVNIKPLNTHGNIFQVIPQLIANFIVGSVHIRGWVSSCDMRSEVNFDFYEHRQNRYWSQLLNAVYFHDLYSQQQGIPSAPTDNLIVYAQWGDGGDIGAASTPMLYHLTGGQFTDTFLGVLFNFTPTSALLSLLHGLLPDMTFRVDGDSEPFMYEPRLAQTAFHELGHASHFRRVNADFWLDLMKAEVFHGGPPCGGYGCGNQADDGNVQVAESWAEYIGTLNALARYPNGVKRSVFFGNNFVRFDTALEREMWFFNNWIPTGVYNDLSDFFNTAFEPFDNTGGASVQQMYDVFNSDVDTMCEYQERFLALYPFFARADVESIFGAHGITGCAPINPPATHAGMTWTVLQQIPGVVHVGTDAQTNPYNGDTPAAATLPVLCLNVDNSPVPAGITPDFYNGWARGSLALTPPVPGSQLTSPGAADALCAANFGPAWRMAEFHDGGGGWSYWGFGNLPVGTRFWTAINDQPANPWN
jgi:hypothetical protein